MCVYFNNLLLRGNRARKVSADTLDAFDSPNFPPLGRLEVHVTGIYLPAAPPVYLTVCYTYSKCCSSKMQCYGAVCCLDLWPCVTVYWDLIQRPSAAKQFNVHTLLSNHVAVLRVFPNISPAVVRAFLQEPIEGKPSLSPFPVYLWILPFFLIFS